MSGGTPSSLVLVPFIVMFLSSLEQLDSLKIGYDLMCSWSAVSEVEFSFKQSYQFH